MFSVAAAMLRCIEKYLTGDAGAAIAVAREAALLDAAELPPWRSVGCPVLGISLFWTGRADESADVLGSALPRAEAAGNHLALVHGLGCLALAAAHRYDDDGALRLAERALTVSHQRRFDHHWATALAHLALGTAMLGRGDLDRAEAAVARAVEASRRGLARIELAFGLLALADVRSRRCDRQQAGQLVAEAMEATRRCPDPGLVAELTTASARRVRERGSPAPRALLAGDDLSPRELRVLALLPTNLTLREVSTSLFVSINTVKTQVRTIYRKLGVTNRAEAVARARQPGLA